LFDRYEAGEKAILVHIKFPEENNTEDLNELKLLVDSAGVSSVAVVGGSRRSPSPRYFVGEGKAQEIAEAVIEHQADVIIFNHSLAPSQERNLESLCQCRVMDRTALILDIFALRARTHEGKLQVELAQLRHLSTRLIRGWTHLERQGGGVGLRGPGETQLETDRRLLRVRVKSILRRLERVEKQRNQGRRARLRAEIPTVSLVGYTNAGKSTLFNQLTEAKVYAADQLFATLDPTLRRLELDDVGPIILADTVGFIRHLPHDLVAAFRATLQETRDADILLHVIDCHDEQMLSNIEQVDDVLAHIGSDELPSLLVYNKIDLLDEPEPRIVRDDSGMPVAVYLSAQANIGLDLLFEALTERLGNNILELCFDLPMSEGRLRSIFYQKGWIKQELIGESSNWKIIIRLPNIEWQRLLKSEGNKLSSFIES